MKAIIYKQYGPPSVLSVTEINKPIPKDNELLIRVHASTINRTDCGIRSGVYWPMRLLFTGLFKPKLTVSGTDFAGEVLNVGSSVTEFKVGDKVFGFNDEGLASHAQYITPSIKQAIEKMPQNCGFEEATALIEGAHYALNFINKTKHKAGQTALVNGATGAIGSAAVQLLKHFGLQVTAVCATDNIQRVKALGADHIIDYLNQDFTQSNEQYDYVYDSVGKSSFGKCRPILNKKGIYISSELGEKSQNIVLALLSPFSIGKKVLFPFPTKIQRSLRLVKTLAEEKKFVALIDRSYPMEKIIEACTYVETGEKIGNVIITYE